MSINSAEVDLGDNYTFHADGKWKSIFPNQSYHETQIYPQISNFKFDERYIIAKQNPDRELYLASMTSHYSARYHIYNNFLKDSTSSSFINETTPFIRQAIKADYSLYKLLKSKGVTVQNQLSDQSKIQSVLDSIFRVDPFFIRIFSSSENYWLIDKDNNIRYGPFSKTDFEIECNKRNVGIKFE